MEVRSVRTPQPARVLLRLSVAALAASVLSGIGCAHFGRPVVREIVWQGEVTVQGTVVIAPGERLVIRPGTRVLFAFRDDNGDGAGDSGIVVRGSVQARGTQDAPIEFAPENPGRRLRAGWDEVLIEDAGSAEFARCRFVGAQQAVHAHRTPLAVEDCRFEGNGIGIRFTGGPVVIRRNRFVANGTAVRYWREQPDGGGERIRGERHRGFRARGSARSVITGNNFRSSADYHVKLGESQAADVDARDNWWGTVRREEIERLIFDREDAGYLGGCATTAGARAVAAGDA